MKLQSGFTLIELLVTMAVVAVLIGAGVPALMDMLSNRQMISQLTIFNASTAYARSKAVAEVQNVVMCSSTDNATCAGSAEWETGWIIFLDRNGNGAPDFGGGECAPAEDCLLKAQEALTNEVTLRASANFLTYNGDGSFSGGANTFRLCSEKAEALGDADWSRSISINAAGSMAVEKGAARCP